MQPIGYGAMRLTGPGVFGPPQDRNDAVQLLPQAIEGGVDHIETAEYYGPHVINELIRQALHPYPTELVLVTKVGARGDNRGGILAYDEPASSDEESRRTCGPATWPRFRWSTCASCGRHDRTRCSTTNSPR